LLTKQENKRQKRIKSGGGHGQLEKRTAF
jgi:hypothetical protein